MNFVTPENGIESGCNEVPGRCRLRQTMADWRNRESAGLRRFQVGRPENMDVIDSKEVEGDAGGKPHTLS